MLQFRRIRFGRVITAASVLAVVAAVLPLGAAAPAQAAPVGAGFEITVADIKFILSQVQIAEAHRTREPGGSATFPTQNCTAPLALNSCANRSSNIVVPGSAVATNLTDARLPYGLRQVDGRNNNLTSGYSRWNGIAYDQTQGISTWGSADQPFPRLTPELWRTVAPSDGGTDSYDPALRPNNLVDNAPREISNLIADQSPNNPAAISAAGTSTPDDVDGSLLIPNVAPNAGVAAPYNGMFTLFGQFFDHGLDLVGKTGSEVIDIQIQPGDVLYVSPTDPAYIPGASNHIYENRTVLNADNAGTNTTTPWIDQNQTYTSHPSHQVFLRDYSCGTAGSATATCTTNARPVSSGSLLDTSNAATAGDLGNWGEVKIQALQKLGIQLSDYDVTNVPLIVTDEYGRFIRGPQGFPIVAMADGTFREGTPTNPVQTVDFTNPSQPVDLVKRINHAFLDDIAHGAAPRWVWDTASSSWVAAHNVALLAKHFITGDGRGNENIGLTSIHTIFHAEHNRVMEDIKATVAANEGTNATNTTFAYSDWRVGNTNTSAWNGERLFQAARLVTEMEYQHLVFGEFARKVQPLIRAFAAYDPTINPNISAEFANAVYRYGHSQLDGMIARTTTAGANADIPLLCGFLNPDAFNSTTYNNRCVATDPGTLNAGQAAGQVAQGMTKQIGNEIDEFVTNTLRNTLLGVPLDLASLNLGRGRDTGMPSLNGARAALFAQTKDPNLQPYASWNDFGQALRHPDSLINFIAAYGTHPFITSQPDINAKRCAAYMIARGSTPISQGYSCGTVVGTVPNDRVMFLMSDGDWAPAAGATPAGVLYAQYNGTGLEDIDLWIGGLAEQHSQFGGMLGSTFDYIFKTQLENLQESDRLYYLGRLAGTNLGVQIEANSFSEIIMRNTTAVGLPGDAFAYPSQIFDMTQDPAKYSPSIQVQPNGAWWYVNDAQTGPGTQHVVFNGVDSGPTANDGARGGTGNDTLRGNGGDDTLQGYEGDDNLVGGAGNDIILDSAGTDILTGGPGQDYMASGGTGLDLFNAGSGSDFVVTGGFGSNALMGAGNDYFLGGTAGDVVSGDDGSDWLEGGQGADTITSDTAAPFGIDVNPPGDDVAVGNSGNNIMDGGGGLDVFLGGEPGTNTMLGGLGFDWETFYNPNAMAAQTADLTNINPTPGNIAGALANGFLDVEALSGGDLNDTLSGDIRTTLAVVGTVGDTLNSTDVPKIGALNTLLGNAQNGTANTQWNAGDILIGGAGSDTLQGRQGNDLIDGDAYLQVQLSVPNTPSVQAPKVADPNNANNVLINSLSQAQPAIAAREFLPGDISIVRNIKWAPHGTENDTAVYFSPRANYTITTGANGRIFVTDATQGGNNEGTDTLQGIETLQFSDIAVTVSLPPAPQNVTAVVDATGLAANNPVPGTPGIIARWTAPAGTLNNPILGYQARAWAALTGGVTPSQSCTTTGTATLTCLIPLTGLTPGSTYYVDVAARNTLGYGLSGPAARIASYIPGGSPLVTNVQATAGRASTVVTWTIPTGAPTGVTYLVQAWDASTGGNVVGTTCSALDITTCTISGLTNGTTYYVDVTSTLSPNAPVTTTRVAVTPAGSVPGSPTNLLVTPASQSLAVQWTAPDQGQSPITGYTLTAWTKASGGTAAKVCKTASTSCTLTGLGNGTTYYLDVTATNTQGTGLPSSPRTQGVPGSLPSTPAAPNISYPSSTSILVGWQKPATNGSTISGYTVQAYSLSSGGTRVLGNPTCTTNATTLTCTVTGLQSGNDYWIGVTANSNNGSSGESPRTLAGVVPSTAPTGLALTYPSTGTVRATWATWTGATGYSVQVWTATTGGSLVANASCTAVAPATTCDVTIPQPSSGTYAFTVAARNSFGTGLYSTRVAAVRPNNATSPTLSYPSSTTVRVNWGTVATNATDYTGRVYNAQTGGAAIGSCTGTAASGGCDISISGLTAPFWFSAQAVNAVGASTETARVQAVGPGRPGTAPTVSNVVPAVSGKVNVLWTAVGGASGYQVVVRDAASVVLPAFGCTTDSVTLTCDIAGLTPGVSYGFTYKALSPLGNSAESPTRSFTPAAPGGAVAPSVTVTGSTQGTANATATVNWSVVDGGSAVIDQVVTVYRQASGGPTLRQYTGVAGDVRSLLIGPGSLTAGSTVYVTVTSRNAVGSATSTRVGVQLR